MPRFDFAETDREYEIMRMITSGKPLGKIADELALSPRTVGTYRNRVSPGHNSQRTPGLAVSKVNKRLEA